MLDNFGMGEFLMLALFALLFFGPERLPEMGARIGRWLGQLTQASKMFMTQWTEEAAAIQDAVREVQGIRDEIRAAQAEISGSLDIARQDIEQTIGEAQSTVRQAAVTPRGILQASEDAQDAAPDARPPDTSTLPRLATAEETETATRRAPASSSGSESEALSKTQNVLDDLMAKRGLPPATTEAPGDNGAESTPDQDAEYERNVQAISEIMERDAQRAEQKTTESEPEADQTAAPSTLSQPASPALEQDEKPDQEEPEEGKVEQPQETAFDKTQRILDGLLGKPAEPEPEAQAEPSGDQAESRQEMVESLKVADTPKAVDTPKAADTTEPVDTTEAGVRGRTRAAKAASPPESAVPSGGVQRVTGLQQTISYTEFTKLSIQVTQLRRELKTLQKEIQTLSSQASGPDPSPPGAAAEDDSKAVPMEEAA